MVFEKVSARARRVLYGPPPPAPPPSPAPKRYIWLEEAPPPAKPKPKKRMPTTLTGTIIVIVIVLIVAVLFNSVAKQVFGFSPPYDATMVSNVTLDQQNNAVVTSELDLDFTRSVDHLDLPLKGSEPYGVLPGQGQISPAELTPGLKPGQLWYYQYESPSLQVTRSDTANPGGTVSISPQPNGDPDLHVAFSRSVGGHMSLLLSFTVLGAVRQGPSGPMLDVWPYLDPGAEHGSTRGFVLPDGLSSATIQLFIPPAMGVVSNLSCQLGTFSGAWTNVFSLVATPCGALSTVPTPTPIASASQGLLGPSMNPSEIASASPTAVYALSGNGRIAATRLVADLPTSVHPPAPVPGP